ncbi:phage major capsid protein, HK97 family [Ruaniaceae bacterium KH17]|nr:phage major capsid protein, HK97 family [Ruaniaceae bacterium KH17]
MATIKTPSTPAAWSPDLQAFLPDDVVPDALILRAATVVTRELEGDAPVARIPWVTDDEADIVAEGGTIPEGDPTLNEVIVSTFKVAKLLKVSREQFAQNSTAQLLSTSAGRAVTVKGNAAFIAQPAPTAPAINPPEGVLTQAPTFADAITTNLDPLADAIATIESVGGKPALILANPLSWGALRKLKTAGDENTSLLGAGTTDAAKMLLGIPVETSPAIPAGRLLVVDPSAIAAAVGPVQVAQSTDRYFEQDAIGLRVTWRIGWAVQRPARLGVVNVEMD